MSLLPDADVASADDSVGGGKSRADLALPQRGSAERDSTGARNSATPDSWLRAYCASFFANSLMLAELRLTARAQQARAAAQATLVCSTPAAMAPLHGRANRSGWDFRVFQLQNLV